VRPVRRGVTMPAWVSLFRCHIPSPPGAAPVGTSKRAREPAHGERKGPETTPHQRKQKRKSPRQLNEFPRGFKPISCSQQLDFRVLPSIRDVPCAACRGKRYASPCLSKKQPPGNWLTRRGVLGQSVPYSTGHGQERYESCLTMSSSPPRMRSSAARTSRRLARSSRSASRFRAPATVYRS
jgi:hypothetical protein